MYGTRVDFLFKNRIAGEREEGDNILVKERPARRSSLPPGRRYALGWDDKMKKKNYLVFPVDVVCFSFSPVTQRGKAGKQ